MSKWVWADGEVGRIEAQDQRRDRVKGDQEKATRGPGRPITPNQEKGFARQGYCNADADRSRQTFGP